jgi:hypothetical protein
MSGPIDSKSYDKYLEYTPTNLHHQQKREFTYQNDYQYEYGEHNQNRMHELVMNFVPDRNDNRNWSDNTDNPPMYHLPKIVFMRPDLDYDEIEGHTLYYNDCEKQPDYYGVPCGRYTDRIPCKISKEGYQKNNKPVSTGYGSVYFP